MIDIQTQLQFYEEELRELEFSVKGTLESPAIALYQSGVVFVGVFKGVDTKRGNVFIEIRNEPGDHAPRLDHRLSCFTLPSNRHRTIQWDDVTYSKLVSGRNVTDCFAVDYTASKRKDWITMLVRGMDARFIEDLNTNQVLIFGPTMPPFEYLQNLLSFTRSVQINEDSNWGRLLNDGFYRIKHRRPELLTEEIDIPSFLIREVNSHGVVSLQGPPGTGKTFQIADLVSRLIKSGKSVILTALTNKAAIEVLEKEHLEEEVVSGNVSKLPFSYDESRRYPGLQEARELIPQKGHLHLTTYYQFSRTWQVLNRAYDYVIVEEASQAYLTTIAGAMKVGKHVIVVGDPKQIVPIVTSKKNLEVPALRDLVNGMSTLSEMESFPYLRKIESRRLSERAVLYTNSFYENSMVSKVNSEVLEAHLNGLQKLGQLTHQLGGPTLIQFSKSPRGMLADMTAFLLAAINELADLKNVKIAVLTPYKKNGLTEMQRDLKTRTKTKNYLIETVDRVQGLDVDFVFYVVPVSSAFSFDANRFNVATSRSKVCTYILVADDFDQVVKLPSGVDEYMLKLKDELSFNARDLNLMN